MTRAHESPYLRKWHAALHIPVTALSFDLGSQPAQS